MDCKEALPLLHEYLDGELQRVEAAKLKQHLAECAGCRKRLAQFEKVEALIQAWPKPEVPADMASRIMQSLPPARRKPWYSWVRRHPAISVAVVFLMVMAASFASLWDEDKELMLKGDDLQAVVIEGNTVIVPEGKTVTGDLTVKGGKLQVEGDVQGNLVVIDGSVVMASTAHISGQVKTIDEAFSWVWFKVNELFGQLSNWQ